MKIASFDIFDTCVLRECGYAENAFYLLSRNLYPANKFKQECFYHWRCAAEKEAQSEKGSETITIHEIYRTLRTEQFFEYTMEEYIQKELDAEAELLKAIPSTLKLIHEKRENGYQILFISDMYLPSSFIQNILIREGIWQDGDHLFVSCEHGSTKRTGALYDMVEEKFHPAIWEHYGDNKFSDVRIPKKKGIKATYLNNWWTPVEEKLLEKNVSRKEKQYLDCLVGFMRYARIINSNLDFREASSLFVAPIFIAYVFDILEVSKKERIHRLYFLARDGYILKWIAELFSEYYPEIELKYLYVSRKSMFLPSLSALDVKEIEQYFEKDFKYTSIEQIIKYFKLPMFLPSAEIESLKQCESVHAFWGSIQKPPISDIIMAEAAKAKERILSYFAQEGIWDKNIRYALVDVGWKGSSRHAFAKLTTDGSRIEHPFYYWGTFKHYRNQFEGTYRTYNVNQALPMFIISLIEDFFSASPDLSTIDYTTDGDSRIVPVFDNESRFNNDQIVKSNKCAIQTFAGCMKKHGLMDPYMLNQLSYNIWQIFEYETYAVDLGALKKMESFSEKKGKRKGIIKKVNAICLVKYLLGGNIAGFWEIGSIYYSYKPLWADIFINIHEANRKIVRLLKKRIIC